MVLALIGGAIAFAVMAANGMGPAEFTSLGEFHLWLFLLAIQTSLWAICTAVLLAPQVRTTLGGLWADARFAVLASVVVTALPLYGFVLYATFVGSLSYPLPDHRWKLLVLNSLGTAVALIGVAEIALVKAALQKQSISGTSADVGRYLDLRALLQRLLVVEGAILGTAILVAGGLRNTVLANNPLIIANNARMKGHAVVSHAVIANSGAVSSYPREHVLMIGAFFTILLALLYAPVYGKLLDVGNAILDATCAAREPASPDWAAAYDRRVKLANYLQLGVSTSDSFRAGIAIFAPLTSALLALLLGKA